jgi:UPF0042 nucleotide-binding protein
MMSSKLKLISFGYKNGVPTDVDLVLDVRSLWNPHGHAQFRGKNGRHPEVKKVIDQNASFSAMADRFAELIIDLRHRNGKKPAAYTVAIGCYGGQHRSVWMVDRVAGIILQITKDPFVQTLHRDMKE